MLVLETHSHKEVMTSKNHDTNWGAGDEAYATDVGAWAYQHRLKLPGEVAEAGEDDLLITDHNHVYWAANVLMANFSDSKDASGEQSFSLLDFAGLWRHALVSSLEVQ